MQEASLEQDVQVDPLGYFAPEHVEQVEASEHDVQDGSKVEQAVQVLAVVSAYSVAVH
jgi:hypothetical protein